MKICINFINGIILLLRKETMEIRQLEYFIASVEERSFLKGAEKMFTTQPNISKAIRKLEKEIGASLLERTGKGVRVTVQGEKFYHYAKNIMQQVNVIKNISDTPCDCSLKISSYPSNMIARSIVDTYRDKNCKSCEFKIEYKEGSVQEIIDDVSVGISEIGILYVSKNQIDTFNHIIGHKDLVFESFCDCELCIYVGKNNPLYDKDFITIDELKNLKFVRGVRDYFSVEHHFSHVNLNSLNFTNFNDIILTNSDHLVVDLLEQTDICYLGINFMEKNSKQYDIKLVKIENSEKFLNLGYVKHKMTKLSAEAEMFLNRLKKMT